MGDDGGKKPCGGRCRECAHTRESEGCTDALVRATRDAAERAEKLHRLALDHGYTTRDVLNMFSIAVRGAIETHPDKEAADDARVLLTAWATLSLDLMGFMVGAMIRQEKDAN